MLTSEAVFLQKPNQEHFSKADGSRTRQLANALPKFVTNFTTQQVSIGRTNYFYFTVSDSDSPNLTVTKDDTNCPAFVTLSKYYYYTNYYEIKI